MATPPPPMTWETVILLNDSIDFPRDTGGGTHEKFRFMLARDAASISIEWTAQIQCPYGYRTNATLTLFSPGGDVFTFIVYTASGENPSGVTPYVCNSTPPSTSITRPPERGDATPEQGEWRLESFGECTCSVSFLVMAQEPR